MSSTARRTVLLLALVAVVCLGASLASAATPTVTIRQVFDTSVPGGEFDLQVRSGSLGFVASPQTRSDYAPGFRTFCVQTSQDFNSGATYEAVVSTHTDHTVTDQHPLDPRVAYLFHQWNKGDMVLGSYAYDYARNTLGRRASGGHLQSVIWALQNGAAAPSDPIENAWYTAAHVAVNGDAGHGIAPIWSGLGSVRVLNLESYDKNGNSLDWQDQLIETPEPATLALLAIGALPVLPIARRRRTLA